MDSKIKKELLQRHQEFIKQQTPQPETPKPTSILSQDPMSPYTNPISQLVYSSVAEEINKRSFKAVYPQSYTPISTYFSANGIAPYYNPGEDVDYAHGAITIAGMIDLVSMGRPWSLERVEDFTTVIDLVVEYRDQLRRHSNTSRNAKDYLIKVEKFLSVMERGRLRAHRRIGKEDVLRSKDIKYFLKDLVVE